MFRSDNVEMAHIIKNLTYLILNSLKDKSENRSNLKYQAAQINLKFGQVANLSRNNEYTVMIDEVLLGSSDGLDRQEYYLDQKVLGLYF